MSHERHAPRHGSRTHEVPEGAHPTTNQPLNARPRPRVTPALITFAILAVALAIFFVLALF